MTGLAAPFYRVLLLWMIRPHGVIEEFAADESYFRGISARLERDLRKIPGALLLWQTEEDTG
jgi:hypothetical protein